MKNNMQRVIGNIVILTPVIVGLVFYKQLPNQIAIHYNVEEASQWLYESQFEQLLLYLFLR